MPENSEIARLNTYQIFFEAIPKYIDISENVKNKFMFNWNKYTQLPNMCCTSKLLDTSIWNVFTKTENSYAIGSPTLEMWVQSWNKVYPTEKISYDINGETGYYINIGNETQTNTIIENTQISALQGYSNPLYYPHVRRI